MNILYLQYSVNFEGQSINLPVSYDLVRKTEMQPNPETSQMERYSPKDKNELFRDLLHQPRYAQKAHAEDSG